MVTCIGSLLALYAAYAHGMYDAVCLHDVVCVHGFVCLRDAVSAFWRVPAEFPDSRRRCGAPGLRQQGELHWLRVRHKTHVCVCILCETYTYCIA